MKKTFVYISHCAALILGISTSVFSQDSSPIHKAQTEEKILLTASATVQEVDIQKREITLKGPLGDVKTLKVDPAVKRLNEIKVGDKVTARYFVSIAADLREPTAAEKADPIMTVSGVTKASKDAPPGAQGLNVIRVVATVEGLERPTRLLTLKGPRGKYISVRAKDTEKFEKLHLGDTIVVTFTEALAVSIDKENKPTASTQ